jgi:O-antigen ligase
MWLVVLPLLRPLVWSGELTDLPNLLYLVLLAAAIATGLMLRGLSTPAVDPGRRFPAAATLGAVFLAVAAVGAAHSPLPARAWTLVAMWVLHLGAPLALWPVIRARPGLVVSGLLAGLVGEGLVLVGQVLWERPDLQRSFRADPALVPQERMAEQYEVRIFSWRLEGSFLLANTLAAYLITVWPLLAALAWKAWRAQHASRWALGALLAGASLALAKTGSKAGILALAVAVAATSLWILPRWRWRTLAFAGLVGFVVAALAIPGLRARVLASADVRVDYWRAALAMIGERPLAGYGLEGFSVQYPRVKPAQAEDTIIAHQELLQAAVDLGIPGAVVLGAWWTVLLWRLRPTRAPATQAVPIPLPWPQIAAVGGMLLFALLFVGVLHVNLLAYPGGRSGWTAAWAALIVAALIAALAALRSLPRLPPAACFCGVLACWLHAQADFHLHSPQVVGVVALVAVLGLTLHAGEEERSRDPLAAKPRQMLGAVAAMAVLVAVLAGVMGATVRLEQLEQGRRVEDALRRACVSRLRGADATQREDAANQVDVELARAGLPVLGERGGVPDDAEPVVLLALATAQELVTGSERFPADADQALVAVGVLTYLQELAPHHLDAAAPLLERLAERWPGQLAYAKALADHYLRRARRAQDDHRGDAAELAQRAVRWAREVVALYPTCLPFREDLIAAARLAGDQVTVEREIGEIRALAPLVYPSNRPRLRW